MENVRDGNNNPIWRDGLTEDAPNRVLGRPVVEADEIPSTLGAGSDETEIWYLDPSFYYLGTGEAMRVDWGTQRRRLRPRPGEASRDRPHRRSSDHRHEAFAKLQG
jgi:HK97 family phage major capsid protein